MRGMGGSVCSPCAPSGEFVKKTRQKTRRILPIRIRKNCWQREVVFLIASAQLGSAVRHCESRLENCRVDSLPENSRALWRAHMPYVVFVPGIFAARMPRLKSEQS